MTAKGGVGDGRGVGLATVDLRWRCGLSIYHDRFTCVWVIVLCNCVCKCILLISIEQTISDSDFDSDYWSTGNTLCHRNMYCDICLGVILIYMVSIFHTQMKSYEIVLSIFLTNQRRNVSNKQSCFLYMVLMHFVFVYSLPMYHTCLLNNRIVSEGLIMMTNGIPSGP